MRRLRFLGCAVVLTGCFSYGSDVPTPHGQGGTGGTPSTAITGTEGNLFDAEGGQPACCVNGPTPPFQGLSWFKFGEPGTLGPCPNPTAEGFTGYQEMKAVEPHTCGACACSPAPCTLPEGTHTNAAKCAGADGSMALPYGPDPAAGWSGMCSDSGALPANLQCNGVPCVQSITVPPLGVAPCKPTPGPADPFPTPEWARMARECVSNPLSGEGCEPGQVCVTAPPPGGLTLCLYGKGDHPTCPPDYPARTVFYENVEDGRGCEACECSDPTGTQCLAIFQTFSDPSCTTFEGGVVVTEQEGACFDVVSGTALASAEATMLTDMPGSCTASGGAPFGGVQPADPVILCCQGYPDPPG